MNRPFSAVCTFPLLPSPNGQRAETMDGTREKGRDDMWDPESEWV